LPTELQGRIGHDGQVPLTEKELVVTHIFPLPRLPLTISAVAPMLITLATGTIAQTAPPDLPGAILCYAEPDQSWRVGYLFRVKKDGEAVYISPDGKLTASVNAKGLVEAPANRPAGVDCYGKTLDDLRSSGRTMEFQRTK
jgi:hypothetical protein